jgi:hypothetical protein
MSVLYALPLLFATLCGADFKDQTNLNNAYVSGMKEDLNIQGNEYTYMVVLYNAVSGGEGERVAKG